MSKTFCTSLYIKYNVYFYLYIGSLSYFTNEGVLRVFVEFTNISTEQTQKREATITHTVVLCE